MSREMLRAVMGAVLGSVLLGATTSEAHQCVEVDILDSPRAVVAGEQFEVVAGVVNCGSCATPVDLEVFLYIAEDIRPIRIGGRRLVLRLGGAERVRIRCQVPPRVPPGRYSLVLLGTTPGSYSDFDRVPLVVERTRPWLADVQRLLCQLLANPTDGSALEALAEAAEGLGAELAGDLRLADQIAKSGQVKGWIRDIDYKKKTFTVIDLDGSPTKITTDGNTTIQDDSNPPKTLDFGDLYKGTDVEVKYDSNNVATKIVKTS